MPLYEYRCEACGHEFELIQKYGDRHIRKCESCGRLKVKRVVSQTSFVLKGSGWYATEYGKGAKQSTSKDGADKKTSTGDKKSSTSESKPTSKEPAPKAATA